MIVPLQLRVAAVLLWYIMGSPTYGNGPFEHVGIPTTVPLLVAFLLGCMLASVAGVVLWKGDKGGAIRALALLPAGTIFWWGFALPLAPIFALVRTSLIMLG